MKRLSFCTLMLSGAMMLGNQTRAQNNLQLHYPFNVNTNDYAGTNHATAKNSPATASDKYGYPNHAYSYDGVNQYMLCGDILDGVFSPASGDAKFTVLGWAKTDALPAWRGGGIIIGKICGGSGTTYEWSVNHDDDGKVKGYVSSSASGSDFIEVASGSVSTGQWFSFALVFDGSQANETDRVKFYVDAVAGTVFRDVGTLGNKTSNTNQNLTIGAGHNQNAPNTPNNLYDGTIDEIRIYDRVLSLEEIETFSDFGLKAYYPLNSNANNYIGSGLNGTLQNSPVQTTDRLGDANLAYNFNGSTQYAKFGDILDTVFNPPNDTAKFTVSGWAKTDALPTWQGGGVIIGKTCGGGGSSYEWAINHDNDGKVKGFVTSTGNGANFIEVASSSTVSTGTWFSFSLVFDGSLSETNRVKLYVNGTAGSISRDVGTLGTDAASTNQEMTVAAGHNQNAPNTPNNLFDGSVDEIRIFDRALTQDQTKIFRKTALATTVNENASAASFLVYPNPSSSGLFYLENIDQAELEVISILGQQVKLQTVNGNKDLLDLSGQTPGVYFLKVRKGGAEQVQKIVIQ